VQSYKKNTKQHNYFVFFNSKTSPAKLCGLSSTSTALFSRHTTIKDATWHFDMFLPF